MKYYLLSSQQIPEAAQVVNAPANAGIGKSLFAAKRKTEMF
jgi:hypothetical protein